MRVFDIEKTCLADEFTQFNKPLRKIAYSPTGDLLVTCSDDGSVALHNASRQHLPTKMMHLEFPPKFVHVAFSPATKSEFIKCSKDDLETETEEFDRNEENRNYKNFDAS
jgi:WD40 repeat protein